MAGSAPIIVGLAGYRQGRDTLDIQLNLQTDTVESARADKLLIVEPNTSTREVFLDLQRLAVGSALVCEGKKLVGIFTERDAVKLMAAGCDFDVPISAVMVTEPMTIPQGAPLAEAIRVMATGGYRRLPIIDADGEVVGVIKVSNILHYFVDHFPAAVFNLPPKPNVVMPEREGA